MNQDRMRRRPQRLGEILMRQGVLTEEQVRKILQQQQRGGRPFGDLAERLFAVEAVQVEDAWVQQPAPYTLSEPRAAPKLGPFHAVIDQILRDW